MIILSVYRFIEDFDDLLSKFEYCNAINSLRPKLEPAAAMASRLIARRAQSFRVQPSFMYFRKMNIALCRLKELNIYQDIFDIKNAIGVAKTARKLDDKYYLPDQQNFFHFLTKFQSFSKLLVRIVMCARQSHRLFLELLHRAAFIEAISLFSSVLAEVWTISIEMCKNAVKFYNGFYPFYAKNYDKSQTLPKRLNEWLGEEYTEYIDISLDESQLHSNEELILFGGEDDEGSQNQAEKVIDQKFEPKLLVNQPIGKKQMKRDEVDDKSGKRAKAKMFKTQDLLESRPSYDVTPKVAEVKARPTVSMKVLPASNKQFDLGEKISRSQVQAQAQAQSTTNETVKHINVEQLKTIKEIREFLSVEDVLRHGRQEQNTKGIKNDDWETFKSTANNLLILSHHGLVLKKFRNEWKKLLNRRR